MKSRGAALVGTLLLAALALAGCSGGGDADATPSTSASGSPSPSATPTPTRSPVASPPPTPSTPPGPRTANLEASATSGQAPLGVTFELDATATQAGIVWELTFGDQTDPERGDELPATVPYTYEVAGNFTATLTVTYRDGREATDQANVTVTAAAAGEPIETHFEFGPSAGCAGGVVPTCVSFLAGPEEPAVDGHWQALDSRYWGLTATTAMGLPPQYVDSDCQFVADDATTILADASNGGGPCTGVVPAGTAWIYLYPYAVPSPSMTLDFA